MEFLVNQSEIRIRSKWLNTKPVCNIKGISKMIVKQLMATKEADSCNLHSTSNPATFCILFIANNRN